MAAPAPSTQSSSSEKPRDDTFRNFNPQQAANYAELRRDYHPKLYKFILDHHAATGGQFDVVLDIGCGPGTAVRALAPHFKHGIGLDPSEGMISTAKELGGSAGASQGVKEQEEDIRFAVSTAEQLGDAAPGSVDLLVAATAAHWFDMSAFWCRAAEVVKPGGTVALWSSGSMRPDPSMPRAEAMQRAADELEAELDAYMLEGNRLTRDLYVGLGMPWDVTGSLGNEGEEKDAPGLWDKDSFVRQEWGTTTKGAFRMDEFHVQSKMGVSAGGQKHEVKFTPALMEMMMGTGSPVMRWREAHPELVGTEEDVVRVFRRKIEKLMSEAGLGMDEVKGGLTGVMLLVKRR